MSTALIPMQDMTVMANAIARSGLFGMKTPEQALALMLRVYGRCVVIDSCWIFTGSSGNSGYGKLRIGHSKDFSVHRLSYAFHHGEIPHGLCVLHRCDNRKCVNPSHLFIGTKRDNTLDMVAKGRHFSFCRTKTHCPKGHPYSGKNINGARICRICQNAATLAHYHRSKNEHGNSTV